MGVLTRSGCREIPARRFSPGTRGPRSTTDPSLRVHQLALPDAGVVTVVALVTEEFVGTR